MKLEENSHTFIDNGTIRRQPDVSSKAYCFRCGKTFGTLVLLNETDKYKAFAKHAVQVTTKYKIKTVFLPQRVADDGTYVPPSEDDIKETINVRR